jgi:FKBP-type peptidyl-prolyl cis-trans isomerase
MRTENLITLFCVIAAAALVSLSVVTAIEPPRETYEDQGQLFFPAFEDPLSCVSLEVQSFDKGAGAMIPFKVALENGRWTIPSHHGYPADAREKVTQAAIGVIGLTRDVVRSDNPADHKTFGVVDPMSDDLSQLDGRAHRVTYKDAGGRVLADLLVGSRVEGKQGYRYVRIPGQNRVYEAKFTAEISTRFEDWIDTKLLSVVAGDIQDVRFNHYSFDESRGRIVKPEVSRVSRGENRWSLQGLLPDESVNVERLDEFAQALGQLTIVGVRKKPDELYDALMQIGRLQETPPADTISFGPDSQLGAIGNGYYVLQNGGYLVANEGDLTVRRRDGMVYTFYHGIRAPGAGVALSAGLNMDEPSGELEEGNSRYLLITVHFDPSLVPAPTPPTEAEIQAAVEAYRAEHPPKEGEEDPHDPAKELQARFNQEHAAWQAKVKATREEVQQAQARFNRWYYVVSNDLFRKIRPSRDSLVKKAMKVGETITTESGLNITELVVGTGAEAATGNLVKVHYTGTLEDGTTFDSSHDRGEPFEFPIGQGKVIRGWDEGVVGMKVGGKRKLVIPAALGYGDKGSPPIIPPGATLVFEIELLDVR